jgi:hypothetical protein
MNSSFYTLNVGLETEYNDKSESKEKSTIFKNEICFLSSEFEKALKRIAEFERYLRLIKKLATSLNVKYLNWQREIDRLENSFTKFLKKFFEDEFEFLKYKILENMNYYI